ncbi:MAG: aminotransferase class I/II-fold pyridoxal phosphate-dependent enzyme [Gammaproteobacteria bacterium]|nr:aminotransferase class I/II-fold pyridoxal phosphate-dependent enzyme [Gammaproteobacteria bacterium]
MTLLGKFEKLREDRTALLATGADPFGMPIDELYSPTEARIAGRRVLLAGTNNYLGLTFAPECLEAAHAAIDHDGTGTTGSRMANGSFAGHRALEREIAEFYECRSAIVFTTGYQANLGMISGLTRPGDVLMIDADSHASIYDGCKLSGAEVLRFRHNDAADLRKRLTRLGERAASTLVIVEGIYSMLGDRAPLAEIVAATRECGSCLLVDEAHSLGVLGEYGRGLVEEADVLSQVDFILGTFSKSLGSVGGYCASNRPELDLIRYASRPYVFTASPSPSVIASTRAALRLLRNGKDLRVRLWEHARKMYGGLKRLGYRLGPEPSPVVAAILDSREQALTLWRGLFERGVYVNLVFPPAAPGDKSLVRCSVSAAHSAAQIETLIGAFAELRDPVLAAGRDVNSACAPSLRSS